MTLPKKILHLPFTFWAIITLGLVLRILALTQHDFWFDEAFTYYLSRLPFRQILTVVSTDNNPPLYYQLIHFVVAVSKNEIILRLPSFVAGMATIPLTYFLVYKFISRHAALSSAAFVSLSPLTVYLSTEARPHSLGILFATLEIFAFLTLIKKPTRLNSLLFVITTIIGFYTHYYIVLLLVPFTFLVIKKRGLLSLKKWLMLVTLSGLPTLPWVILSLAASHNNCWCPTTMFALPSSLVSPATSGVGIVNLRVFTHLPIVKFSLLLFTSLITMIYFVRGLTKSFSLTIIYLGPLLILSAIGIFANVFSPRAFAVFSPVYFSIVALGVQTSPKKRLIIPALLLLFGLISLLQSQDEFFKGERIKPVYNLVKTKNVPITHTSITTYYPIKYYSLDDQQNFLISENPLNSTTTQYIGGQKNQSLPKTNKLWVVDYRLGENQKEDHQKTVARLLPDYHIERTRQFDNIFVSFLELNGSF